MPGGYFGGYFKAVLPQYIGPSSFIYYDVPEAIQAYFLVSPALTAATADGKFWFMEAEEGTDYPFAEYLITSETDVSVTTGPYKLVRTTVQISCHEATSQSAKDLSRLFEAAFWKAPLSVQGLAVCHCLTGNPTSAKGEGKGPKGQDSFMETIDLDILWTQPVPPLTRPPAATLESTP